MLPAGARVIVDAQIHVWEGVDRGATPHSEVPFGAADAIAQLDAAGVDGAILVPPLWDPDGNRIATAAAAAYPDRFRVMARPWVETPPASLPPRGPFVLGYRVVAAMSPYREQIARGETDAFWREAERASVPVMVFAGGVLAEIERLAGRHQDMPLIVDCFGLPRDARIADVDEDITQLVRLARFPNVHVKASALPCYSAEAYPFRDLHAAFARVLDAFGHERLFWGSDLTRLPCTYVECVDFVREALPLDREEREWVLGRGLATRLGWPRLTG